MDNRMLIDWVTFSVRPDPKSSSPAHISKDSMIGFLKVPSEGFIDIGYRQFYEHCYTCNGIKIHEPAPDRLNEMGVCVSMSGEGCRWFEGVIKDGEMGVDVWRWFFNRLRDLTKKGFFVNVSRLDIAVDDFDGELQMDEIERNIRNCEIVSCFRSGREIESIEVNFKRGSLKSLGDTIEIGSRKSKAFCRFYDKKLEQLKKCAGDREQVEKLESMPHWVRMEFEFKDTQAVKMINAICDSDDFGNFFSEVVNGYIRFVNLDDVNVSRRSIKEWWLRFIGTMDKLRLTVEKFENYSYKKLVQYYDKYLTTTVFTILAQMPQEEFMRRTYDMGVSRLRPKHLAILGGESRENDLSSFDWWQSLNPLKGSSARVPQYV